MSEAATTTLGDRVQSGLALPLMEDFYTIQGEGHHTGIPAYFVRLGGCDVGCHWCDVKESWEASDHPVLDVETIADRAAQQPGKAVVVTGGEPAMYPLDPLTDALRARGLDCWIETSGAHPISGNWHWICFSPKKFKAPLPEAYEQADELKVVVFHKSDLAWAEEHAKHVRPDCQLFLQPEWGRSEAILPLVVEYVKQNPRWRISLQTHKYLNIP